MRGFTNWIGTRNRNRCPSRRDSPMGCLLMLLWLFVAVEIAMTVTRPWQTPLVLLDFDYWILAAKTWALIIIVLILGG